MIEDAIRYVIRGRPGQNDRPAYPAGHPLTWGLLTAGTTLDGSIYPFPVFDTVRQPVAGIDAPQAPRPMHYMPQ